MSDEISRAADDRRGARVSDGLPECIKGLPIRSLANGEALIVENSISSALFFLEQGRLEVRKDGIQLAEVGDAGAVFGEMSVLLRSPYTATVLAATDSTVRVVTEPESFLRDHPDVALYVARILARRLDAVNRYLVDLKRQFGDETNHLAMVDEVLGALMNRHPRVIERRRKSGRDHGP